MKHARYDDQDSPWLLQAVREENDRAVVGEYVQRHTGPVVVPLNPTAEENPHRPLEQP